MKTIIAILFFLPSAIWSQSLIGTHATFGRYSDNCLGGRGLCSFNVDYEAALSKVSGKMSGDTFVLKMFRTTLSDADQIRIAGKRFKDIEVGEKIFFRQSEAFVVDPEIIQRLGMNPDRNRISAGDYPITLDAGAVSVVFKLTAAK